LYYLRISYMYIYYHGITLLSTVTYIMFTKKRE